MIKLRRGMRSREFQTPAGLLHLAPLADRAELEAGLGAPIAREDSGKPYLIGDRRHISIAHTREWFALLVGSGPCGVDIEWSGRDAARVAARVAAEDEIRLAGEVYGANPQLAVWCAKEAAFKAAAMRRDVDFRRDIRIISPRNRTLLLQVEAQAVEVVFLEVDELLLAVAKVYSRPI